MAPQHLQVCNTGNAYCDTDHHYDYNDHNYDCAFHHDNSGTKSRTGVTQRPNSNSSLNCDFRGADHSGAFEHHGNCCGFFISNLRGSRRQSKGTQNRQLSYHGKRATTEWSADVKNRNSVGAGITENARSPATRRQRGFLTLN